VQTKKRPQYKTAAGTKEKARRKNGSDGVKRTEARSRTRPQTPPPEKTPCLKPAEPPSRKVGFSQGILNDQPAALKEPLATTQARDDGIVEIAPQETDNGKPAAHRPAPRRQRRRGPRSRQSRSSAAAQRAKAEEKTGDAGAETEDARSKDAAEERAKPGKRRSKGRAAAGPRTESVPGTAKKKKTREKTRRTAQRGDRDAAEPRAPGQQRRKAQPNRLSKAPDAATTAHEIDFDESEYGPAEAKKPTGESKVGPAQPAAKGPAERRPRQKGAAQGTDASQRPAAEKREMLINIADGDECRIALLQEGRLEELYTERAQATSSVGNIYKGRVTNVEPSIQAAFIDFGLPAHGFLHISDLHPKYFPDSKGEPELVGKKTPRRHRPPIQNALRPGQEVMVQVIKEGIGTKGPTLSSYISLPGRFLVMMPDMEQLGVSRKIEDEDQRRKLRTMLGQLSLPSGTGFIVRTAGVDRTKRDLQRDLNYLTRLWKKVARRIQTEPAPAELYKESDLVIRTIRDVYDSSLRRVIVDSPMVAERVREFLSIASPRSQDIVTCYTDSEPMFHRYGIESEIDKLHSRQVPLPCGGSLVIEQTEALVAIDVNSGRFRVPENAEETAHRVNLEAVDEIARQLRLRDLGGLIIIDLIDMTLPKHQRAVERRLSEALKKHKERANTLRISSFGILEMTRQRQRPSLAKSMFQDCSRCGGSGRVKAPESVALDVMRQIRLASHQSGVASIDVRVATAVANDLLNRKRHHLTDLERETGQTIRIHGEVGLAVDELSTSCTDRRGREVPGATTSTDIAAESTTRGVGRRRREQRKGSKRGGPSPRSARRRN
jgi:ribonuclease E